MCKAYLCDVQLSAHTCFPSGWPWWKGSWRAATRPEAFSAHPSVDGRTIGRQRPSFTFPVIIVDCLMDVCAIGSNYTLILSISDVWFARARQGHDTSFFLNSFCILHFESLLCSSEVPALFHSVRAAGSTCLPVMWKGWELIALYIEVLYMYVEA